MILKLPGTVAAAPAPNIWEGKGGKLTTFALILDSADEIGKVRQKFTLPGEHNLRVGETVEVYLEATEVKLVGLEEPEPPARYSTPAGNGSAKATSKA